MHLCKITLDNSQRFEIGHSINRIKLAKAARTT